MKKGVLKSLRNIKGLKRLYTIFVFIALAAFEHIIIGLFPPLFHYIARDLNINIAKLGFISAMNILTTAISSIYWGYLSGKWKRKKLIVIGTLIWVISIFLTANSQTYTQLLFYQILTGVGLGSMAALGFSVLTDTIPFNKRGLILSLWGMAQGLGGIGGSVLASLTSTHTSWRWPFDIVGFIGLLLMFLYFFVEEPVRGESDPEIKEMIKNKQAYTHIIEIKQLKSLLLKGSNVYLYLQAFFLNISTGSLIWLPTLYVYKIIQQGYRMDTAVIASGYLYAIFQIGGMISFYFGHLGDRLQRKTLKGRAYLTSVLVIITMPLYIIFFVTPMTHLVLPDSDQAIPILLGLIQQMITNPWLLLLFVLAFLASATQSANTPNWLALITDVNLPEHRGAAFSLANLFNSLGRTVGNLGVGILFGLLSNHYKEPYSYIITLSILQLFLIPSALYYIKMAKMNVSDIKHVKKVLKTRTENQV